ncbi:hypothetical protein CO046_02050 [Candidatus Peregrinibacteria bacterium CG_4_9_14_0_2_um_filter_53_11]|nr:MAG: hypothetical protein CO046_02050 [Candidatus Peregrinibacteria bacterium CG_4_9_14_0_2_um_filter_53_11]
MLNCLKAFIGASQRYVYLNVGVPREVMDAYDSDSEYQVPKAVPLENLSYNDAWLRLDDADLKLRWDDQGDNLNPILDAIGLASGAVRSRVDRAIRLADRHGIFDKGNPLFKGTVRAEIKNNLIQLWDAQGGYRGGLSFRAARENLDGVPTINDQTVADFMRENGDASTKGAMVVLDFAERQGLGLPDSDLDSHREGNLVTGFTLDDDGNYELGSKTEFLRLKPSGRDFFDRSGARSITLTSTKRGEKSSSTETASWNPKSRRYEFAGSRKPVVFLNGWHYKIELPKEEVRPATPAARPDGASATVPAGLPVERLRPPTGLAGAPAPAVEAEKPREIGESVASLKDTVDRFMGSTFRQKNATRLSVQGTIGSPAYPEVLLSSGGRVVDLNRSFTYPRNLLISIPGQKSFDLQYGERYLSISRQGTEVFGYYNGKASGDQAAFEQFSAALTAALNSDMPDLPQS